MKYILAAFLFFLPFSNVLAQNWKLFSDTGISFTTQYPPDWKVKVNEQKRVFFTSPQEDSNDKFYQNVNVGVSKNEDFDESILTSLMPQVIESLSKQFSDFTKIRDEYFVLNGHKAYSANYTAHVGTVKDLVRICQWFCITGKKLYTITYTALDGPDRYKATGIQIMKGIKFE